jgi:uncharacterized protein YggE
MTMLCRSKVFVVGIVVAVTMFGVRGAEAQATAAPQPPQIVVTGQGEAKVVPDRAAITIGVQARAATAAVAASENARKQRAIIDTLKSLGIPAEQIGTQNYGVSPEMAYDQSTQRSRVTGYVVSNNVRVELKTLDLVSKAIDASLAKGANQISSLEFKASNPDELRHSALTQAVSKARADAEALARAAGGALGPLVELTSMDVGGPPIIMRSFAAKGAFNDAATPIEPGTETLRVSVTVRWQFVPTPR